jgi:hypothetical protein
MVMVYLVRLPSEREYGGDDGAETANVRPPQPIGPMGVTVRVSEFLNHEID